MHEISLLKEVVRVVEQTMEANRLTKVDTVVLQIGELTNIVPHYMETSFPAAVYKTSLEGAKLRMEILPGMARCRTCGKVFNVVSCKDACPQCTAKEFDVLSGEDFRIKEILAC